MIENNSFFKKTTTHLIINLTIWCTGTFKFFSAPYNLPFWGANYTKNNGK